MEDPLEIDGCMKKGTWVMHWSNGDKCVVEGLLLP